MFSPAAALDAMRFVFAPVCRYANDMAPVLLGERTLAPAMDRSQSPNVPLNEEIEWQLVTTLYGETAPIVVGTLGLVIMAVFGWSETHEPWYRYWAAGSALLLAGRLLLERAFRLRGNERNRTELWRRRFIVGSAAMGVACGCASLVVFDRASPYLQMIALAGVLVLIIGGAARNAGCPTAATGQIVAGLLPALVACAWIGDRYHLMFCLVIAFEAFAAFSLMSRQHARLVRLLQLNHENLALVAEISRANAELSLAATTDSLTGLANRRRFDTVLRDEAARARRDGTDLALLLLDIDSFKAYNDMYGHPAGDDCLSLVAREFAATLRRPGDLRARYGGEEFVGVLAGTRASDAAAIAEAVRARIEALAITHLAGVSRVVTVSIGVAALTAEHPNHRPEALVKAADEALYAAKAAGRNRVRVAPLMTDPGVAALARST